ncbi:hypothetical protein ACGFZR_21310 [Streptomyces sp. NPDC048241]|uniref:hypothetical protein n=1 Tax=Streptomyces sp. NPDC048241 TaxID=3365521 RepID=UPI00371EC9C8
MGVQLEVGGVIAQAERRGLVDLDVLAERVRPFSRGYGLKPTATGRDVIDHLVRQAGESLRRQQVELAGREGFAEAVRLLSARPDLAAQLARHARPVNRWAAAAAPERRSAPPDLPGTAEDRSTQASSQAT